MQCIMHTSPLQRSLAMYADRISKQAHSQSRGRKGAGKKKEIKAIQRCLHALMQEYWDLGEDEGKHQSVIAPKQLFAAVQQHALYGQYDEFSMEDSTTLLLDVTSGLDDKLVEEVIPK